MRLAPAVVCCAAAVVLALAIRAQAPVTIDPRAKGTPPDERPDIRARTDLVLIPVSVSDALGRPVANLAKEHFRVIDNKVPQTISSFLMDDGPVAVGLVLDTSNSMGGVGPFARRAAGLFVRMANPGDDFLLVETDDKPRLTVPLTNDIPHIRYELTFAKGGGATALTDGVYMAMHEIKKSKAERKALIVVSDGGENNSRYSQTELRTVTQESEVVIYTVLVHGGGYNPFMMQDIADATGGRMFKTEDQLPDIAAKISVDLRNRYVLGYVPTNAAHDGLYHKVEVELNPPRGLSRLKTHWRRGYYAPTD